jgi:hypothetical protein
VIEGNRIRSNRDDGIEIRLHPYTGPTLEITIQSNVIEGNGEDGIQLVDYDGLSSRRFRIQGNLIRASAKVGLGLMCCGNTKEDIQGASVPEPIVVYNNTFAENPYAITGGDNLTAPNNIFLGSSQAGIKNVAGASSVAHSLLWQNGVDAQTSNVDATTIVADPLLDSSWRPRPGSPAIDAGVDVGLPYAGAAPDLGAYETM